MKYKDGIKYKLLVCLLSLAITALLTLAFFLDTSLEWNFLKISSCIVLDVWAFSISPSMRYYYFMCKDDSVEDAFKRGYRFGVSKIFLPLLIAPYYALKYYLSE